MPVRRAVQVCPVLIVMAAAFVRIGVVVALVKEGLQCQGIDGLRALVGRIGMAMPGLPTVDFFRTFLQSATEYRCFERHPP